MARREFTCMITGRGGHGAMPDTAIDPVVAAAALIHSAAAGLGGGAQVEWRSFVGGTRFNIIPERVTVTGVLAGDTPEAVIRLEETLQRVMAAFRTEGRLSFTEGDA